VTSRYGALTEINTVTIFGIFFIDCCVFVLLFLFLFLFLSYFFFVVFLSICLYLSNIWGINAREEGVSAQASVFTQEEGIRELLMATKWVNKHLASRPDVLVFFFLYCVVPSYFIYLFICVFIFDF
jgi:hypothetical protein